MTYQNSLSGKNAPMVDDAERSEPRRRPWFRPTLVGFVIIAIVLAALFLRQEKDSPTTAAENDPLNYAEVVIADLIQEESFGGTLGSIEDDPVTTQLGGTVTEIASTGGMVSQGEALFSIDDQ